jgi:general secretion pathway protein F
MSLDDLVALNDEISGLVRAGVPLEMGLAGWGRDLPGKLGRTVTQLSQSVADGRSLPQALAEQGDRIPPVYRAIVTAGMRSGRLPAALESLAGAARSLQQVRGAVGLAVLYPMILVLLGYAFFVLVATQLISALSAVYEAQPPKFWSIIADVGAVARAKVPLGWISIPWGLIPPLVMVVAAAFWWFRTRRAMVIDAGSAGRWLRWIPFAGRIVRHARLASLSEILGMLVEHDVPLHEAIVLAAECTADRRLVASARRMAASVEQGGVPSEGWRQLDGFPPLLAWLISSGGRRQTFVAMARHVADTYRRRVLRESQWLRDFLPMWLIVVAGGGMVALYGVTTFLPFTQLMEHLAETVGHAMRVKP